MVMGSGLIVMIGGIFLSVTSSPLATLNGSYVKSP